MQKIIIILLIVSLNYSSYAQGRKEGLEKALDQLRIAMIDADVKTLDKIIDDSLSYGHSGGLVEGKKNFIEKLQSGKSDFVTMNITDQQITIIKNTAIVRHLLEAETNDSGKPGTVKLKLMQVWTRTKGHWKLLARQAVKH